MGWCVEPMPHFTKNLRRMASGLPVGICEQAISDYNGEIEMAVGQGERWATGCSHCISDNHTGDRTLDNPEWSARRQGEIKVKCTTLDTFLTTNGITSIDFCKIDVEGHEEAILKDYSWRVKPAFMKVEHWHSKGNVLDTILKRQGYTIYVDEVDIYAVL